MWITNTGEMFKLVLIEVWFLAIALVLFFSIAGGKRKKKSGYSWEKKSGASVPLVVVALVMIVALAVYVGVYFYNANTIRF